MRKQLSMISGLVVVAALSIASACAGTEAIRTQNPGTVAVQSTPASALTTSTPIVTSSPIVSSNAPSTSSMSASPSSTPPATASTTVESLEVQMSQLVADYNADPVAAAARYEGRHLLVRNVKVTEVSELYKPVSTDMFVSSQGFKFRTDYLDYVTAMEVGYVVDIEGVLEGPVWGFIVLQHCSYTIIDSSEGIARPDFQTSFG